MSFELVVILITLKRHLILKKSIIVTGCAGFIGANFVNYWLKNHKEDLVIGVDLLTYAGNMANLKFAKTNANFVFVKGDICDENLIEKTVQKYNIDTIVHFAAESHVDRSITGPDQFIETNIIGTYNLLKVAKKCWLDVEDPKLAHRFHHVSTDEVYGTLTPDAPSFTEEHQYAPNSPYSASKAASDHLVRAFHHTYGLNVTTSNCSNNYGPFHFPEKLIPLVITNILNDKPLPIYGDGMQIRDWLYVEDHAYGIDLILSKGKVGETYNIGGNNEWANIDIVKKVCELIQIAFESDAGLAMKYSNAKHASESITESLICYVTDRPGHDRRYAIDAEKSARELGYCPKETFESGINKTVHWYLQNDDWWNAVIDGSYCIENDKE